MRKRYKGFIYLTAFVLAFTLLCQIGYAAPNSSISSKPTEGIESTDPNYGSSNNLKGFSIQAVDFLISTWTCSISNTGTNFYVDASTTATSIIYYQRITLYLQEWNGSNWIDKTSWTFTGYNCKTLLDGRYYSYEHGKYYRTRAEHYAYDGTTSETQYSTSSYIYID